MHKKVVFLGMGGTIAGKAASVSDNVGYTAAQVPVAELISGIAGMEHALKGAQLVSEQVAQLDSKDMTHAAWRQLHDRVVFHLRQSDVAGVVITHGTDTLEETAYFLWRSLPAGLCSGKPVVLTCAMRPATSLAPDGPQNLLDAVATARAPGACGVVVACAGAVHSAQYVQKVHPYRLDAFDSGEGRALGYVEEGALRLLAGWGKLAPGFAEELPPLPWPRVDIVLSHAGCDGEQVRSLQPSKSKSGARLRGLVVAGTGNGTVHIELREALLELQSQGVELLLTTRCAQGQIVGARQNGALQTTELPAVKARIALMLDLMPRET